MKSKITKEWFLIFLVCVLTIHSNDVIHGFIDYLPRASGYKNPIWLWLLQLVQIGFPVGVWYMLLTHHSKLFLFLKAFLIFIFITRSLSNMYFAFRNFNTQFSEYTYGQLFRGVIYLLLCVLIYIFGRKYILKYNQIDDLSKQTF